MTTPVITYREASHELLAQARTELAAGDLRQAAEKGWGAAAQITKGRSRTPRLARTALIATSSRQSTTSRESRGT